MGMGPMELLVLAIVGGVIVAGIFTVLFLARGSGSRVSELEAENRQLRDELNRRNDQA